jgi:predicted HicB family RNase H-like nuclease
MPGCWTSHKNGLAELTKQLGIRVSDELKISLEAEAKRFDLSLNDVCKLKLRKPLSLEELPPAWLPKAEQT